MPRLIQLLDRYIIKISSGGLILSQLLLEAFNKFVLQFTSLTTLCLKTVTKEFKSLFLEPVLLECRLQNDKKVK